MTIKAICGVVDTFGSRLTKQSHDVPRPTTDEHSGCGGPTLISNRAIYVARLLNYLQSWAELGSNYWKHLISFYRK